jgi:predicted transcriptional regulator of viral defense system
VGYRSNKDADRRLRETARAQGGYFTSRQAAAAGYGYSHLAYHVGVGNVEHLAQGMYRLLDVPISEHDELIRLALWSRDRRDQPQAVASHATALTVHELTLLLPDRVHLTVPRGFRKKPPAGCVLHRRELGPADIERREGFTVTKPLRTLVDVALSVDVPHEEVVRAAKSALERGLVSKAALAEALLREQAPAAVLKELRLSRRSAK